MPHKPYSNPSDVTADEGEVLVDGPGNVSVSLTPEAAAKTAERLQVEAERAQEQQSAD